MNASKRTLKYIGTEKAKAVFHEFHIYGFHMCSNEISNLCLITAPYHRRFHCNLFPNTILPGTRTLIVRSPEDGLSRGFHFSLQTIIVYMWIFGLQRDFYFLSCSIFECQNMLYSFINTLLVGLFSAILSLRVDKKVTKRDNGYIQTLMSRLSLLAFFLV